MILFKQSTALSNYLARMQQAGHSIHMVPTMGALHNGHMALIRRARLTGGIVICSIFVNPTQFNDPADLEKYPRPMESDISMLLEASCDVLFLPSVSEVYPNGVEKLTDYDLGHLPEFLEGASRPGHFKGVANVVDRLVTLVKPDKIYFGQKDFQQVKVIERLAQLQQWKLEIVTCPIEREENGLAMSSRNVRLTAGQRENAALISKTLGWIQDHYREHSPSEIKAEAIQRINAIPEATVDYLEFCDTDRFQLIDSWKEPGEVVAVTAVKVGIVRLLDNVLLR